MKNDMPPAENSSSELALLQEQLRAVTNERNKLARELRVSENRGEVFQLVGESQASINKTIRIEKLRQEMYVRLLLMSCPDIIMLFDAELRFLLGTDSISEIMEELHFTNTTHFYKCFKEHYHMTPNQFRISSKNKH